MSEGKSKSTTDPVGRSISVDLKKLRSTLNIEREEIGTYIVAVAISEIEDLNVLRDINCKKGQPLNNLVYDLTRDSYFVECAGFIHLGYIPYSYRLSMEGVLGWCIEIPVPESVVVRHLKRSQKQTFSNWKTQLGDKFEVQLLQTSKVYY